MLVITVEISIYSTCKRISQKILRNVSKFVMMVCDGDYAKLNFSVKRENMEVRACCCTSKCKCLHIEMFLWQEINLQGPLGRTDVRIINSYPSKVILFIERSKSQKSKVKSLGDFFAFLFYKHHCKFGTQKSNVLFS